MVFKLLKNFFKYNEKSNKPKGTPTASYQVSNYDSTLILNHNCTTENVKQTNENATIQKIDVLSQKINHVIDATSLLDTSECEESIPKWIQLFADFNAVFVHSKQPELVFKELCQLNHEIKITKLADSDDDLNHITINQITFVTYGDNEASNSAYVIEHLIKLNEFIRGFNKRFEIMDSFYSGMPSRIIDELLTAQPEMISSRDDIFSLETNSYSHSIKISYLIEYKASSSTSQAEACNKAKLKAFGFLKRFYTARIVNLSKASELVNIRECTLDENSSDGKEENPKIELSNNYISFLRKLIEAIDSLVFGEDELNIINLLKQKEIQVELKGISTAKKQKDHIATIRLKLSCLSFTEKSLIDQNEAKSQVTKVFVKFLLNLKRSLQIFKSDFANHMNPFELTTTLMEAVPDLFEIHETPHYVIIEVKKLKSFHAMISDENNLELAQVEAAKKLIDFLRNLSNFDLPKSTNNKLKPINQSKVQEKIRQRRELIENFNRVNKKDKSPIEIIHNLKMIDQTNNISIETQEHNPNDFSSKIKIPNILALISHGKSDLESREKASLMTVNYLQDISNLITHFTSYAIPVTVSDDFTVGLVNELSAKNSKILKILHLRKDNLFETHVHIVNMTSFGVKANSAPEAQMNAYNQLVDYLKMLSQVNTNKAGLVKINSTYENPDHSIDKLNAKIIDDKNTKIEQVDPEIVTSVPNMDSVSAMLHYYKTECSNQKSDVEILANLLLKCASEISLTHSQSGLAHQLEHCIELSLVNANKTFIATAKRKRVAKTNVAHEFVNYLRMCLNIEQNMIQNRVIQSENMNLDDKISKRIYEAIQTYWKSVPLNYQKVKVLAAFVLTSEVNPNDVRVLSIGTGTKSINSDSTSRDGKVVFDSHAEVIARRALVCLLFDHLEDLLQSKNNTQNVLQRTNGGKFCLKRGLKLHLYISSSPCGSSLKHHGDKLRVKVEASEGFPEMPASYISNLGKIEDGTQKSTFMTCSDKIAMWNVVGVQGGLLSHFIQPIYLDSLIVSDNFDYDSCTRALYGRVDCEKLVQHLGEQSPGFMLSRHNVCYYRPNNHNQLFDFTLAKRNPNSHNWYQTLSDQSIIETINSRTGTVDNETPSRLSKYSFAKRFKKLLDDNCLTLGDNNQTKKRTKNRGTYWYLKEQAIAYQNAKCALVSTFDETGLGVWINAYGGETDFFLVE